MQSVKESSVLSNLENDNVFMGTLPEMVNSSINFNGKNNILFCENNVKLVNASINFKADNAIVYLSESRHGYKINLTVHNDSVFYMGKNNYINNTVNIILSEQKHLFFGNGCLISTGIWIRNADPHLIYDCESKKRINPTKSIFIGDHVWLGQSAMLLKGTQIDSGSIIGAMSVVSGKKIGHNESWAGNPVKKIKGGLFWRDPCVHTWTAEKAEENDRFDKKDFIYKHKSREYISFDEIDKHLDASCASEKRLEYLKKISANNDKNRFVSPAEGEKTGGFFSKILG